MKGQGGAVTRAPNHSGGAEILRGRRMITGTQKIRTMSHVHSSIQHICFRNPQVRKWGCETCFLPRAQS